MHHGIDQLVVPPATRVTIDEPGPGPDNAAFTHMISQLPAATIATFDAAQLSALSLALQPSKRQHRLDFRVSLPWFGSRFYVALLAGDERRSLDRLQREGQITVGRIGLTYAAACALILTLMLLSASVFVYAITKIGTDEGAALPYSVERR